MLKTLSVIGAFAALLSISTTGRAQALPTATAGGVLQVGAGFTFAKPDYGEFYIKGISGYADFDLSRNYGVEADIHYIALITPTDLAEDSYLIGPRFILPYRRFSIYGKGLVGVGDIVIQEFQDNVGRAAGVHFAYAIGGGVEIRATRKITIRAIDLEAQRWPNYGNGLTPTVITIGAAYRFR